MPIDIQTSVQHRSTVTAAFLHHQSELLHFLIRQVNCHETAADLMQDTYLRIARLEWDSEINNPRAFLYRVAGNLALDHLRRQTRRSQWDGGELNEELVCPQPQPDVFLAGLEAIERLNQLLGQLPLQKRSLFVACRVHGKSYRELADEERISPRRVEYIVQQTLQSLKSQLTL